MPLASESLPQNPRIYKPHAGTIKIAGDTPPGKSASAALHAWRKGIRPVEFSFMGSNAGGEAIKAANLACRQIRTVLNTPVGVLILWTQVECREPNGMVIKDGVVLRVVETLEDTLPQFSKRELQGIDLGASKP